MKNLLVQSLDCLPETSGHSVVTQGIAEYLFQCVLDGHRSSSSSSFSYLDLLGDITSGEGRRKIKHTPQQQSVHKKPTCKDWDSVTQN